MTDFKTLATRLTVAVGIASGAAYAQPSQAAPESSPAYIQGQDPQKDNLATNLKGLAHKFKDDSKIFDEAYDRYTTSSADDPVAEKSLTIELLKAIQTVEVDLTNLIDTNHRFGLPVEAENNELLDLVAQESNLKIVIALDDLRIGLQKNHEDLQRIISASPARISHNLPAQAPQP